LQVSELREQPREEQSFAHAAKRRDPFAVCTLRIVQSIGLTKQPAALQPDRRENSIRSSSLGKFGCPGQFFERPVCLFSRRCNRSEANGELRLIKFEGRNFA
jgi:hypothetical protein